jgi:ribonuclease-3
LTDAGSGGDRAAFARRLGVGDLDPDLLAQALRHRSWCSENPGSASNERLEFLGDAVLDLVVTEELYTRHPDLAEGQLAKARAAVVSEPALARAAEDIDLGAALLLGRGELVSGGRTKPSLLADALEAVFGAVYLDRGYEAVRAVVVDLLGAVMEAAAAEPGEADYKTRLQELAARHEAAPRYELAEAGPDHAKVFTARVDVPGFVVGCGEGRSKKQAEQAAAEDAWFHWPGEGE